ncbi:hypothetical protein [Sphingosinicella sp. BN140058]|uniref:hypothetical protein n=1 Tax=Sphingosinicella sp. BN140058 TaxID=1892855 RepID=UPI0013ED8D65|nr:hypothetical protein [Sphingosinicella sp. BN140058]
MQTADIGYLLQRVREEQAAAGAARDPRAAAAHARLASAYRQVLAAAGGKAGAPAVP